MANFVINPSLPNDYSINNNRYKPTNQTPFRQTPRLQGSVTADSYVSSTSSNCTDGKNDGKIGFFSAAGHVLKGGIKFFTGIFTDENGDFSLKQSLKSLGTAGLIGTATFIPVVGPLVLPTVCAFGMLDGSIKAVKGFTTAMKASTDAEAKEAWEAVGNGSTEGVLSYIGYKKTGGFAKGWEKAKTQWNAFRKPKVPTPPASNEIIDTQHLKSNDAKLVEDAYKDIPTAEEQAAYNKEVAYQEPTPAEREALNELAEKNAAKYSESHQIKNNAHGTDKLAELREKLAAAEANPKTVPNGEYMLDGNRYVIKDGNIVEMQLKGAQKPQTKIKNIASHNAKSNVLERLANGEGSSTVPASEANVVTPKQEVSVSNSRATRFPRPAYAGRIDLSHINTEGFFNEWAPTGK